MAVPIRSKGLIFPLQLSSGRHIITEGDDLIISSIKIILSWPLFTREYIDDFGSRLFETLEEQNDDVLITLIRKFVINSLNKWEKRIELLNLNIYRTGPEKLVVDASYKIRDVNMESNLLYEFYTN